MRITLSKLQREEYPDLTPRTLRSWAEDGEIPGAHRIRNRWYVDLDRFYAPTTTTTTQAPDWAIAIARATG